MKEMVKEMLFFVVDNANAIGTGMGLICLVGLVATLWDGYRRLKELSAKLVDAKGEIRTLRGRLDYLPDVWSDTRLDRMEKVDDDLLSRVEALEKANGMLASQVKNLEKSCLNAPRPLSEAELEVLRRLAADEEHRREMRELMKRFNQPITDSEELQRLHKALEDGRHAGSQLNKSLVSPTGVVINPGTPDDDTVARKSTETNLASTATPPVVPEKKDSDNESTTVRTMLHGMPCNITINQSIKIG